MYFAFLGTSGAVPSLRRGTTSLVFVGRDESVLVDCGGSPVQKLLLAGTRPERLERVIVTHIHPDHAYGLPSLIQSLFLIKPPAPLAPFFPPPHPGPLAGGNGLRKGGNQPRPLEEAEHAEERPERLGVLRPAGQGQRRRAPPEGEALDQKRPATTLKLLYFLYK